MDELQLEIQVLNIALHEAEELRTALNSRIEYLEKRCLMLENMLSSRSLSFDHIDDLLENN